MKIFALIALSLFSSLFATDYQFIEKNRHVFLEGEARMTGKADFESHHNGHLYYADSLDSLYLSHTFKKKNTLSWQLGYSYLRLNWDNNPRFQQKNFSYFLTSLGWISTSIDQWRWIFNGGVSVDAEMLNFAKSAVYWGLMWGRFQYTDAFALHVGFFGYVGVRNSYGLPILGIDWKWTPKWKLSIVFPIDGSIQYQFDKWWNLALKYTGFGGPYRYPRRVHSNETSGFKAAIFEVFSTGFELDLNYKYENRIGFGLGGGWNLGGWILTKDAHNHHGKYFHFNGSPYGQANLFLNF